MKPAVAAGALAAAALLGVGAWQGARWISDGGSDARPATSQQVPDAAEQDAPSDVVTVEGDAAPVDAGSTPMAQRSAVIGLLNKRNGVSRDLTMKPGQALRIGDTIVRLRACERTAPWEQEQLTGAFLQLDVRGSDEKWRRAFSGWLYKERPALNVVQHPIYDVWPKSCTMSFPDKGPDTDVLASPSTARKSAAAGSQDAAPPAEGPSTSASASPSNTM
ncbi:DUF2155 domain-containing protein [Sphingomonas sp. IC-11]|nr:DUF2155 domain-containing protein [Sphingomonas sp. IC-11]